MGEAVQRGYLMGSEGILMAVTTGRVGLMGEENIRDNEGELGGGETAPLN